MFHRFRDGTVVDLEVRIDLLWGGDESVGTQSEGTSWTGYTGHPVSIPVSPYREWGRVWCSSVKKGSASFGKEVRGRHCSDPQTPDQESPRAQL